MAYGNNNDVRYFSAHYNGSLPSLTGVAAGDMLDDLSTGLQYRAVLQDDGSLAWVPLFDALRSAGYMFIYAAPAPTGDDANTGLTAASPVRSMARILSLVPPNPGHGVAVILAPGTYPDLALENSGSAGTVYSFGAIGAGIADARDADTGLLRPIELIFVGGMSEVATGTVVSASDSRNFVLNLGSSPDEDEYLGSYVQVLSSSDSSLVGKSKIVTQNGTDSSFGVIFGFGSTPPAGTSVRIVRPNVVLPYSGKTILQMGGACVSFAGVKTLVTNSDFAELVIDNGDVQFYGSEIDLQIGQITLRNSTLRLLAGAIVLNALSSFSLPDGTPTSWLGAGSYLHGIQDGYAAVGFGNPGFDSPSSVFINASVLADVGIESFFSKLAIEFNQLVRAQVVGHDNSMIDVALTNARGSYYFGNGAPVTAFTGSSIGMFLVTLDDFPGNAIEVFDGSKAQLEQVSGTGAGGSGYGIAMSNGGVVSILGSSASVSGDDGDIVHKNLGATPDVPVTYGALTAAEYSTDATSLTRIQDLV